MAGRPTYRALLRAINIAFEGDVAMLSSARVQARDSFVQGRSLVPTSTEATQALEHAAEVAKLLRHNIVQGRKKEESEILKLRIHEGIERGDNDTVKLGDKTVKIGGSCS